MSNSLCEFSGLVMMDEESDEELAAFAAVTERLYSTLYSQKSESDTRKLNNKEQQLQESVDNELQLEDNELQLQESVDNEL